MNGIIIALITGGLSLLGTAIGTFGGLRSTQRVTEVKIEELTRAVREHNNFAKRMPVMEEQIKVLNHRIADIERELQ